MLIGIVAAAAAAVALLIVWLTLRSRRAAASRSSKVVPLRAARKRIDKGNNKLASAQTNKQTSVRDQLPAGEQARPCSLCRKRSARLYFYLDESGRTIGTCKACRPKAEARELDRL